MAKRGRHDGFGKTRAGAALLFLCFAAACGIFYPRLLAGNSGAAEAQTRRTPPPRRQTRTRAADASPQRAAAARYSQFSHSVRAHQTACTSCHQFPTANWKQVRKADAAFPDVAEYPRHESCLNCHRQQFFRGARPSICTVCHTNPSPRDATRHAFPNPREIFDLTAKGRRHASDFGITFPHDKHIEVVSQNQDENWRRGGRVAFLKIETGRRQETNEASCAVCHQTYRPQGESSDEYFTKPPEKLGDAFWLKKGTFKTSPISHASCFTCHSADTGILPAPSNCAACHELKRTEAKTDFDAKLAAAMNVTDKITLASWRTRNSSGTFRHEFSSHAEMSCASCHDVKTLKTNAPATQKVPVASCSNCHITATSDDGGVLNAEIDSRKANPSFQCVKCHVAFGRSAVPESHLKAISALAAGK